MPPRVASHRRDGTRCKANNNGITVVLIAIASMRSERLAADSAASPSHEPASPTSSATSSAEPSRAPAPTSSASETMTTARTTAAPVQGALSDLRAAVAAVSSSGQIDGKKADELSKRVDELAKHHLTEKDGHLEQEGGPHAEAMQVSGRKRQLSALSRLWSLSGQGGPAVGC